MTEINRNKIKELREGKKLTQKELGERCRLKAPAINIIETGRRKRVYVHELAAIASALDVRLTELLCTN
jgi:transcriptional regulator with XRE-family HTH domain